MEIFEKRRMRLIVKSPIHVGSLNQKITPFEYIQNGRLSFHISEEKLSLFLHKKNLLEAYISSVQREGHKFRLFDFFKNRGVVLKEAELNNISKSKARIIGESSRLQEYRPLIRDGFGKVYIPGTSLKGVFRTALLYNVLLNFKNIDPKGFNSEIIERIRKTPPKDFKKRNSFLWLQEEWLEKFELANKKNSPNTDWLRLLRISDAYPKNLEETNIIPIHILKKEKSGWKYKIETSGQNTLIWIECIPKDCEMEFDLSWDDCLLRKFAVNKIDNIYLPKNIDELLKMVNKWSIDIRNYEIIFSKGSKLEKWYEVNNPNFRIGFGSGMVSTTIALLLPEDLRIMIRNISGKNKGDDVAPKSRRVWINGENVIPLGWAILS